MNNELDMQKLIGALGGKENDQLKNAVKSRNINGILSSLNDQDRRTLNTLLSDKKARDQLMSSPQVQQLLQSFMKGKR